jgi:hypothetical protein
MEKKLKTFEVIQIIPSVTFVTYHVQADCAEDAEFMVDNQDESIEKVGEITQDSTWEAIEYDVSELEEDEA